jgi:tRNA (guanine-N7-)-methyltransferase
MSKAYPVSNYEAYRPTRNPYGEKIREFQSPTLLADADTESHKGRWREYFGLPAGAPLQLELGAYHGETSLHLAKTHPQGAQLGVEWKYKQCFKAGKKAKDQGLTNLTFLRANMARLPWVVAPGEVDRIWILFPDPWSKAAHQKWRVLHPGFFRILASLLGEGKELMVKTDHQDYADFIGASIQEAGGFTTLGGAEAEKLWSLIPPTPFERIFLRQGLPIHAFALRRNGERVIPPQEVEKELLS